jgi:hypothetical protein
MFHALSINSARLVEDPAVRYPGAGVRVNNG